MFPAERGRGQPSEVGHAREDLGTCRPSVPPQTSPNPGYVDGSGNPSTFSLPRALCLPISFRQNLPEAPDAPPGPAWWPGCDDAPPAAHDPVGYGLYGATKVFCRLKNRAHIARILTATVHRVLHWTMPAANRHNTTDRLAADEGAGRCGQSTADDARACLLAADAEEALESVCRRNGYGAGREGVAGVDPVVGGQIGPDL